MHDWNTTTINGAVQTRTHGPAHELLTMSGAQVTNSPRTLTYDTKGNMTTDDRGCGMTSDFDNMLQSFAANGVTDLKNATYEYDAIGRRVAKNVAETGGTQTTVFVQAGQQVTCEYTPGNATADCDRKYAYGTYIDEVLNFVDFVDATAATEARYWLSQNRQYSAYAATTVGLTISFCAYDGFGNSVCVDANGAPTPAITSVFARINFTARSMDSEALLHFFRTRQYQPKLGRFASNDRLGYVDGTNSYASYLSLIKTDPFGEAGCTVIRAIGAAPKAFPNVVVSPEKSVIQLTVAFMTELEFKAPYCHCCRFRQWVLHNSMQLFISVNGAKERPLGGDKGTKIPEEDCTKSGDCYGDPKNTPTNRFSPDGCKFTMYDTPGPVLNIAILRNLARGKGAVLRLRSKATFYQFVEDECCDLEKHFERTIEYDMEYKVLLDDILKVLDGGGGKVPIL